MAGARTFFVAARSRAAVALFPVALFLAMPGAASAIEINEDFKPQNEFKLDPWVELKIGPIDMSINKAVLMLVLAASLTVLTLVWIGRRMQAKPNRIQFVIESAYGLLNDFVTRQNIKNDKVASRWFGFLLTLFFFVWFSNVLGYFPMPVNTEHSVDVFGVNVPTLQLYAATANLSVPLALAFVIWVSYHSEGFREHGLSYPKTFAPSSLKGPMRGVVWSIETLSHFLRLISLSVRLFANMLAGHMLILIMGGGMIVLLGTVLVGVITLPMAIAFFLFELGLIASLQAFIFTILSAIYIGSAVSHDH